MNEDAGAVARALADRLNLAAPDHISVVAEGTRIHVAEKTGPWAMYRLDAGGDYSLEELVEDVLSGVQDDLCHATTEPWPAHGSSHLPLPWANVENRELRCGYADVLVLEPIPLADLA